MNQGKKKKSKVLVQGGKPDTWIYWICSYIQNNFLQKKKKKIQNYLSDTNTPGKWEKTQNEVGGRDWEMVLP